MFTSKKINMKQSPFISAIVMLSLIALQACDPHDPKPTPQQDDNNKTIFTGWNGKDDPQKVPTAVNFGFADPSLPSSVDLTPYLPPVGDQGQTGTCVAWACGYYSKTASEAIIRNLNSNDLTFSSNQLSPKYLFYAIPDNLKGGNCDGTDFVHALDVLQQRGVATMATTPFTNLGNCSQGYLDPSWNTDAANHKIKYYRKIDFTLASVKQQLANKNPVVIGIAVTDIFNNWRGNDILRANGGTVRSYHALTVVGYDDNRSAFRVVNSWTTRWGDGGYIWVDYNLFFSNFVYNQNVYIMASDEGNINPGPNPNPNPNPTPSNIGVDLAPWVYADVSTAFTTGYPNARSINFDVYNIGSQPANPSSNWSFYYLYYNAYNANDYGVLFQDAFNNTVSPGTFYCPTGFSCNFNYSIPSGSSFAQQVFHQNAVSRGYFMPPLNGYYYLVLIADPGGAFSEQNEQNNVFYTSAQFPKFFNNGVSNRSKSQEDSLYFLNRTMATPSSLKTSTYNSAVNDLYKNAYTPAEIIGFMKKNIKSGDLRKKLDEQKKYNNNKPDNVYH
jgi:C1A family cysteine protease